MILFFLMISTPFEQVKPVNWEGNLGRIFSTTIRPDGHIYFVNPVKGVVYQTNLNGDALPSIGKKGEGPQEFNWPKSIHYEEPYLYVYDGAKNIMFQIDKSGVFRKRWRVGNINEFSIQGDQLRASLRIPKEGHIFGTGRITPDTIRFDRYLGGIPCCIRVSGSKKAAILSVSDGTFWIAHTGVFQLRHYSAEGTLLKEIDGDLPDYVAPHPENQKSRFDIKGRSADLAKFDKIRNLYECGDKMLLYRAKRLSDSHLDIFTRTGKRIATKRVNRIKPIGVHKKVLYGFLEGDETTPWDIMLVKVYEDGKK